MGGKLKRSAQNRNLKVVVFICIAVVLGLLAINTLYNHRPGRSVISETEAREKATSTYKSAVLKKYDIVNIQTLPDGWFFSMQVKDGGEAGEGGHSVLVSNKGEVRVVSSACWIAEGDTYASYSCN